jgi:uncharacterized protein with FMN-binding domain
MKKIIYAILATISGLVLVFSYRTSLDAVEPIATTEPAAASDTATATPPTTTDDASATDVAADSSTDTPAESTTQAAASGPVDGTYVGAAANTRYGPVQVQITVSGGQIADVQVIDYPNSNSKDQQINQRAIPVLISETLQAQSSQIDMVSGATYTSDGYLASLQSAIDQANA